jgi:hypothetical protein
MHPSELLTKFNNRKNGNYNADNILLRSGCKRLQHNRALRTTANY